MDSLELIILLIKFIIVALAAYRIGAVVSHFGLPRITGYLLTGLLAGPFVLGLIPHEAPGQLVFIDSVALAFIAFAAGTELYLPELQGRMRSIGFVTTGLVIVTFTLSLTAVLFLADNIPFMQEMSTTARLAVALLVGAILVARSPSSAIAIINELRAKGPFTQMALGVTVIMDVLVIILFAISSSAADALLTNVPISFGFAGLLVAELIVAGVSGFLLYRFLDWLLGTNIGSRRKTIVVLIAGYTVFALSDALRTFAHNSLPFEVLIEPLLVCLIASFLVNNYSTRRLAMVKILHDAGPVVYVLFFTLTGASLELDLLVLVWPIALALFFTRLVAIMIGSFVGGTLAGDPFSSNRIKWMAFVTQAGVALGLAKEVAVEFPLLGNDFATLIIAVVVINETIGPLFFKRAIKIMGESHERGEIPEFDGVRDVIIFGQDGQAVVLARQLVTHGWEVKLAWPEQKQRDLLQASDLDAHQFTEITRTTLDKLQAPHADAIVTMLSDDENHAICELAYEHFGTELLVVLLRDRANTERFRQLGALIVDPSTALVSLLDHTVRAPSAASIFLGMDDEQDILDLEVRDPFLAGVALHNLRLPLGTIVLSIHRNGQLIMPHGYTRLSQGDRVTIISSPEHIEEVTLRFDA